MNSLIYLSRTRFAEAIVNVARSLRKACLDFCLLQPCFGPDSILNKTPASVPNATQSQIINLKLRGFNAEVARTISGSLRRLSPNSVKASGRDIRIMSIFDGA